MIKLIVLLKRKDGLTQQEFSRSWEEIHGLLAAKIIPGLKRCVHNYAVRLPRDGEPRIDRVAELWFDDLESWRETANWYLGDEGKYQISGNLDRYSFGFSVIFANGFS